MVCQVENQLRLNVVHLGDFFGLEGRHHHISVIGGVELLLQLVVFFIILDVLLPEIQKLRNQAVEVATQCSLLLVFIIMVAVNTVIVDLVRLVEAVEATHVSLCIRLQAHEFVRFAYLSFFLQVINLEHQEVLL